MVKQVSIRKYQESDKANVQTVTIETGPAQAKENAAYRDMILTAFCNYYIEQEPENCFVADYEGKAIGYIMCAENAEVWAKNFQEKYIDKLENDSMKQFQMGIMQSPLKYAAEYPAHLHIDILPDFQHMGIGTRLMDTLIAHLKEKGNPGLMLGVGADNVKGRNFYNKYGFHVLAETEHEVVMAIHVIQGR